MRRRLTEAEIVGRERLSRLLPPRWIANSSSLATWLPAPEHEYRIEEVRPSRWEIHYFAPGAGSGVRLEHGNMPFLRDEIWHRKLAPETREGGIARFVHSFDAAAAAEFHWGLHGAELGEDEEPPLEKRTIENAIREFADDSAAQGWSTHDRKNEVQIARFGDAVAVDGDALVSRYWREELGIRAIERPETWNEVGTEKLERWLRRNGYELSREGGRVPTTEEEISAEHVARHLAEIERGQRFGRGPSRVEAIWEYLRKHYASRGTDEIYWTTKGDVDVWVKR